MAEVTDFSKVLEEELTCKLCTNIFQDPRKLQCFHKFCFKCIEKWVEKCSKEHQPVCPICKEGFAVPDGEVSKLQPSYYMETLLKLLDAIKNSAQDDKEELRSCVSCETKCKPTGFCAQCNGMICTDCLRIHNTLRVFKEEHQFSLLSSFKRKHLNSYIISQLRCHEKSHEKYKLEYFCQHCSLCICQLCASASHKPHTVVSIEEPSETNQAKQLESIDMERVTSLKEKYTKEMEISKKEIERYGKETEKAIRNVRDTTLRYTEMIREHEMLMIAKLNELYHEQHERYEDEEKNVKSALSFFEEFDLQGQDLQDKGVAHFILQNQHEMPQYEELMKCKLSALDVIEKSPIKRNASVEYVPNIQVTQCLKDLGKVVEGVTDTGTTVTK